MFGGYRFDRTRVPWWIFGTAIVAVLLYVLYAFLGTFVFGLFLYYSTRPVYQRLYRRIGSRSLAAAVALVALAVPFILLLAYTGAVAVQELSEFLAGDGLGGLQTMLEPYIDLSENVQDPAQLAADLRETGYVASVVESAPTYAVLLGNTALHVFVMLALAYYLLKDDHVLAGWVVRTFGDERGVLERYCSEVDRDFQSVFFGNILNAFITAIVGAIVFSSLNVWAPPEVVIPYAALVGVLCGAASLIPVVGMKLVYLPVATYLFARALAIAPADLLWFPIVFLGVAFVLVDFIPDMILRPYVSGRDLHLGSVMLAYILGPMLFGWYGIFLGPMLLIVAVHFVREVLPALVAETPVRPYAVDPAVARIPRDHREAATLEHGAGTGTEADATATSDDGDESDAPTEGDGST